MTRRRIFILSISLALLLFIVEIVLIRSITGIQDNLKVVFTRTRITANTVISADMLIVKEVPRNMVHMLSFDEASEVEGKRASTDLEQGEMLLSSKIGEYGDLDGIGTIKPGNRLLSMELKGDQVNAWCIMTGQQVDILYIPDDGSVLKATSDQAEQQFCMKLPFIRVAAIVDDKFRIMKSADKSGSPKYLMVEVTPEQSEILAYAKGNGRIEIVSVPETVLSKRR